MAGDVAEEWLAELPGLDRLWSLTKGHGDIRIAILDGPADQASVANIGIAPSGAVEHATHVQSIVSGSNDGVVPGIAPGCTVFSIPIFDAEAANGVHICSQERLGAAVDRAVTDRANIINISAAQQADLLSLSAELAEAIQRAVAADILVVAAVGNHGCACDAIPASISGVLAVGAHDGGGAPLLSSNWGLHQRPQGVIAPGANIAGACVGGGLCRASGTSFAAAIVSGVGALLMSLDVDAGRQPSGMRTRRLLIESSVAPEVGEVEIASRYLSGRLNIGAAVERLLATHSIKQGETMIMAGAIETEAGSSPQTEVAAFAPASTTAARVQELTDGVSPADCGCGCGGSKGAACNCGGHGQSKPQLVNAIGRLGVSFISQTRRDAIWRQVNGDVQGDLKPISDKALRDLFKASPFQAQSVVWTLSRTEVPMYAIVPGGSFAAQTYEWLVREWADPKVEFVSVPGVMNGRATLYDGSEVDLLIPDLRGMYSWNTAQYVTALKEGLKKSPRKPSDAEITRDINRFLSKIYFAIRNRGLTPEERALNAAAVNAFNIQDVIVEAGSEGLALRDVAAERSPLNRPGADYYDVLLTFFDPRDRQGVAPLRARFTVDVSDTVPVLIGEPATWYEY